MKVLRVGPVKSVEKYIKFYSIRYFEGFFNFLTIVSRCGPNERSESIGTHIEFREFQMTFVS